MELNLMEIFYDEFLRRAYFAGRPNKMLNFYLDSFLILINEKNYKTLDIALPSKDY
jgi:hypothetical protein